MNEENSDFKVVDKRFSANQQEAEKTPEPKSTSGEGFVMKEKKEEPRAEAGFPSQIDFSTLIFSLATGAMIHLGLTPDPGTKKTQKNLELAKQNIDILSILKEKTKGNLTEEEGHLLENLLTESRLRFVEASR